MNFRLKRFVIVTLIAAALSAGQVMAHGIPSAKYGGQVVVSNEVSYELTRHEAKTIIYIEDHGKSVKTAKYSGKLILLRSAEKQEFELKPEGVNGLVADTIVKTGDKLIARLSTPSGKALSVRFEVK
ncbi:MAG: hypothetical protein Q8L72_01800 [Moraxellaceae bacterium]|nr:hypothetical protein [Moraxellaceae bacterium]